jgi:hypothetical protein
MELDSTGTLTQRLQQAGFEVVSLEASRVNAALVDVCRRYTTIRRGKGRVLTTDYSAGSRVPINHYYVVSIALKGAASSEARVFAITAVLTKTTGSKIGRI